MNRSIYYFWLALLSIMVTSCATHPATVDIAKFDARSEIAAERANTASSVSQPTEVESPSALTEDLLSLTSMPKQDNRLDIEAKNRPARQFFADLGESQNLNILVDSKINDAISLSLQNVTLKQVLMALQDIYGYEFKKTSYGYRVSPNQLSTRVYRLNYLNLERSGTSKTVIGGDETNTVTTDFSANSSSENGFWAGIEQSVLGFISNADELAKPVVVNRQTGLLIVQATTTEHIAIAQFLADAELIMQKQVIIEAKIVEVTLDHEYRSGINWALLNNNFGSDETSAGIGLQGSGLQGIGNVGGVFNLSLNLDNFTSMLQLLDYQGDVQVLSSPRVSTINNQKAVIKVGTDNYYATVTTVTTTEDDTTTTGPAVELEQFFSGIALDVTPQISGDDTVTLHVRPTVTEVNEQTKVINIGSDTYSLPVASSNIRESDSIIRAKSGNIIVIGGLLQQKQDSGSTGVPFLSNIPFIRGLFAQDREVQQKSELVILLKPTVYDEYTAMDDVDDILNRLE